MHPRNKGIGESPPRTDPGVRRRPGLPQAGASSVYDPAMHDLITVVLIALATHRLTLGVVDDRLPERLVLAVQNRFERAYEKRTGTVDPDEWQSAVAYLLSCRWCMSIWVGGAVTAATDYFASVPLPVLVWLASSSVTGLLGGQKRGR